jgi:hypothetical protein
LKTNSYCHHRQFLFSVASHSPYREMSRVIVLPLTKKGDSNQMKSPSHKRTISLVIGLTFTAALLWASAVGGRTATLQDPNQPTLLLPYFCDDSDNPVRVSFTWTRQMPGNGAWLGTVSVDQGTRTILSNKPIQVFDATGTDPVVRQFQAQDGSFYCGKMTITGDKKSVSWSECRNWGGANKTCIRRRPGGDG